MVDIFPLPEGMVFRRLIENNFAGSTYVYKDMLRIENLMALRRRLTKFYGCRPRARGAMSAIGRLTLPMFGPLGKPRLRSKAAECRNLVPLLKMLCAEYTVF